MADYVIRGRLEISYDSRPLEQRVQYSMQRIQRIVTGTGTRLGHLLGTGLSRGVNAAVTDSNKRIGSIATVAKTTGRLAGEQMARGITAKLGTLKLGGGAGGSGGHWTAGPKGWAGMLGAQLGSGNGLLSGIGGALGGMITGGPVGSMIGSILGRTLSLGFSPFISALDTATRSLLAMNSSLQQSEYGMASLFTANLGTSFEDSRKLSKGVIRDLRHDAAMGVGDEPQYLQTYQRIMTSSLTAGADLDRLRRMTGLIVGAGFVSRGSAGGDLAGFDFLQLMSGNARPQNMQVLGDLLQGQGLDFGKLNTMSKQDRFDAVEEALGKLPIDEMGKTWESRTGAFSALLRNLAITGSSGLFQRMNAGLGQLNEWLMNNEKGLNRFVRGVGALFEGLWDFGAQLVAGIVPFISPLVDDLAAWGAQLRSLGVSLERITGDARSMELLGAFLYGGVKFMFGVVRIATGLLDLFVMRLESMIDPLVTVIGVIDSLLAGKGVGGALWGAQRREQERDRRIADVLGVDWRSRDQQRARRNLNLGGRVDELTTPKTLVHIDKVEVKVDTEVNAEPTRVAQAWEEAVGKIMRNRRTSRAFQGA